MFGGEGTKPGRSGGQCVRLAADGGGYVRLSEQTPPEGPETERGIFLNCIKTGTLLYPLAWLNSTVSVQVGAEVTMAANRAFRIDIKQHANEEAQRLTLIGRAGVGGGAVRKQATFISNADGTGIEAANMGTDTVERAHWKYDAIAGDEEVIAATFEVAAAVFRLQVIGCEAAVAAGGGAMHYDQVDTADTVQTKGRHAVGGHYADGNGDRLTDDDWLHELRVKGLGQKGEPKAFSIIPACRGVSTRAVRW